MSRELGSNLACFTEKGIGFCMLLPDYWQARLRDHNLNTKVQAQSNGALVLGIWRGCLPQQRLLILREGLCGEVRPEPPAQSPGLLASRTLETVASQPDSKHLLPIPCILLSL